MMIEVSAGLAGLIKVCLLVDSPGWELEELLSSFLILLDIIYK